MRLGAKSMGREMNTGLTELEKFYPLNLDVSFYFFGRMVHT